MVSLFLSEFEDGRFNLIGILIDISLCPLAGT